MSQIIYIPRRNIITTINYGALYNWYAASDSRNIANVGWNVPTHNDRDTLLSYLGGTSVAGGKLKEVGLLHWNNPNTGATNEVGFNLRGAGLRVGNIENSGRFSHLNNLTFLWCRDQPWGSDSYMFEAFNNLTIIISSWLRPITTGGSIRLVKDSTTLTNGQTGTYTGNDGRTYKTICIGTQEWLADNLCETKYRNGDSIPEVTDNATWSGLTTGALCAYNNDWNNV